jgi:hypothetical protein
MGSRPPTPNIAKGQLAAIIGVPALLLGLRLFFRFRERVYQRRLDTDARE